MKEKVTKLGIPAGVAEPYFCDDKTDFYKLIVYCLLTMVVRSDEHGPWDPQATLMVRTICHEYLALVISDKMRPYEMGDAFVKKNKENFSGMLNFINELMAEGGMPIKEGDNGKMEFDEETIMNNIENADKDGSGESKETD